MKLNKKHILILICILMTAILSAQSLKYHVNRNSHLFIGSPFHLNVEIESALNDSIFAPQKDTIDIFQILDITQVEEINEDKKISKLDLKIAGFNTGEYEFPELEFAVKTEADLKILKTKPFIVTIESVLIDSIKTVKDIAPPTSISLGFWDYFFPISGLIILVLIIIYLKKLLKKEPVEIEKQEPVDNRPAYVIALELLEIVRVKKLLEKGEFVNFHFELSLILRFFIEKFYAIKAVEMTTSEIRENLVIEDYKEKSDILKFLSYSDRIKFAKLIPSIEDSKNEEKWLEKYLKSFETREFKQTKNIEGDL